MWQHVISDFKYGLIHVVRSPGFSLAVILIMALGIALNVLVFSNINAILSRATGVYDADQVVYVNQGSASRGRWAPIDVHEFRQRFASLFDGVAGFEHRTAVLDAAGSNDEVAGELTIGPYFSVLGVTPALGRLLHDADSNPNDAFRPVVLSFELWTRTYASDPEVLGSFVAIDEVPFTVVGIAPRGFHGLSDPGRPTRFWVTKADLLGDTTASQGLSRLLGLARTVVARYRPPRTLEELRARLNSFRASRSDTDSRAAVDFTVFPVESALFPTDPEADASLVRMVAGAATAVSVAVLITACLNIAGMMTARFSSRRTELGVRLALGATLGSLFRLVFGQAVALSLAGVCLGVIAAAGLGALVRSLSPVTLAVDARIDPGVMVFAAVIGLASACLISIIPARLAMRGDLVSILGTSGRNSGITSVTKRLGYSIVSPQIAIAAGLLIVAMANVRSLAHVMRADAGIETEGVGVMPVQLQPDRRGGDASTVNVATDGSLERLGAAGGGRDGSMSRLLDYIRSEAGIVSAALATVVPTAPPNARGRTAVGRTAAGQERITRIDSVIAASESLPATLQMSVLRGRDFRRDEMSSASAVAIVSESVARGLWPTGDPLLGDVAISDTRPEAAVATRKWYQVIGVVNDVASPRSGGVPGRNIYIPAASDRLFMSIIVRSRGGAAALADLRRKAQSVFPELLVFPPRSLALERARELFPRFAAAALAIGAGLGGLALAVVGLYGVVSYMVSQRGAELAIRSALGAPRRRLAGELFRETSSVVAAGALPGVCAGWLVGLGAPHLLGPNAAVDAQIVGVVVALVSFGAAAGSVSPLWRAAITAERSIPRGN